jgi:hypothetical protein
MLVYPREVYERETQIVRIFSDADALRYWRLGLIYGRDIGVGSAGPYRIVVAFADVKSAGPWADYPRRVAYLNCAGGPDHFDGADNDGSDNLITPASFNAGEPLTIEPTEFGAPPGTMGTARNAWIARLRDCKTGGDKQSRTLGLSPLHTSVERWGKTY